MPSSFVVLPAQTGQNLYDLETYFGSTPPVPPDTNFIIAWRWLYGVESYNRPAWKKVTPLGRYRLGEYTMAARGNTTEQGYLTGDPQMSSSYVFLTPWLEFPLPKIGIASAGFYNLNGIAPLASQLAITPDSSVNTYRVTMGWAYGSLSLLNDAAY